MGFFNRNKAERYMEDMRKQAEAQVIKKVELLVLMKQLVPKAQKLADELGITRQEALIYLKAKEGIKENGHKTNPPSKLAGVDWQGLLGKMGDYGGEMGQMGANLMNIGLGDEEEPAKPSRGRGQRKTKRTF